LSLINTGDAMPLRQGAGVRGQELAKGKGNKEFLPLYSSFRIVISAFLLLLSVFQRPDNQVCCAAFTPYA
jgi:hypothetical protein